MSEKYYIVERSGIHGPNYGSGFVIFHSSRRPGYSSEYLQYYAMATEIRLKGKYADDSHDSAFRLALNQSGISCGTRTDQPLFVAVRGGEPYEFLTGLRLEEIDLEGRGWHYSIHTAKRAGIADDQLCILDPIPKPCINLAYIKQHARAVDMEEFRDRLQSYTEEERAAMADSVRALVQEAVMLPTQLNQKLEALRQADAEAEAGIRALNFDAGSLESLRPGGQTARFCSHCGEALPAEGKFCPKCGAELQQSQARTRQLLQMQQNAQREERAEAERQEKEKKDNIRLIIYFLLKAGPVVLLLLDLFAIHNFTLLLALIVLIPICWIIAERIG